MRAKVNKAPFIVVALVIGGLLALIYGRSNEVKISADKVPMSDPTTEEASPKVATTPILKGTSSIRFCGSNTIGASLAPALVEEFLTSKGVKDIRREASGGISTISGTLMGEPFRAEITSAGTGTAFQSMAADQCDIAMASREVSPKERLDLAGGLIEHVLGLDGIAIVAASSSPVESLLLTQVATTFASGVWPDGRAATVVSYDEQSGTYDTFQKLALNGGLVTAAAQKFSKSEDILRTVATNPNAIGFVSLAAAKGVKILAVGEAGVAPTAPTVWTVVRESYPLTRRLYFYTHNLHTRPMAESLVGFALSDAGQRIVAREGFVDLSVKATASEACLGCPAPYLKATVGKQRLSVDFRFITGSSDLDSRALQDVTRVVGFVKEQRPVMLIGFADNSGAPEVNQRLSLARAERVKAELAKLGLNTIATQGFGSLMPVASNSTEEGRHRNRRVEVWVN